jgi:hypothetical protein
MIQRGLGNYLGPTIRHISATAVLLLASLSLQRCLAAVSTSSAVTSGFEDELFGGSIGKSRKGPNAG